MKKLLALLLISPLVAGRVTFR